jgi:hypothetical protein
MNLSSEVNWRRASQALAIRIRLRAHRAATSVVREADTIHQLIIDASRIAS